MYVILYIENNRSTANNASHLSLILFTVWTLAIGEMNAQPSTTYLKWSSPWATYGLRTKKGQMS